MFLLFCFTGKAACSFFFCRKKFTVCQLNSGCKSSPCGAISHNKLPFLSQINWFWIFKSKRDASSCLPQAPRAPLRFFFFFYFCWRTVHFFKHFHLVWIVGIFYLLRNRIFWRPSRKWSVRMWFSTVQVPYF